MKTMLRCVLLGLAFYVPEFADACTIPVFRYALEKWDLTPYDILVYHRGPLPDETRVALKKWSNLAGKINLDITPIDLDGDITPEQRKLWQRDGGKEQTPWMIVRYRAPRDGIFTAWSGPCTAANLHNVIDSPMRQTILKQLAGGASIVFVLLNSGDTKADDAARVMAEKELRALEKMIKPPVQSADGPQMRLPLPLKITLPLMTLDRNSAEEAGFVKMLLATEELDDKKGPILFPIFGRGRVLGSLAEKELTPGQILEVAKFLCRECSCQVKDLNPGIDMLMVIDWNATFDKMFEVKPAPAAPVPTLASTIDLPAARESVHAQSVPSQPSISASPAPRVCMKCQATLWIGIGVASGLVLLSGAWVIARILKPLAA